MPTYSVIPMKFGTAAETKSELLEMLDRVYIQFKTAFNKLRDKIELAVQVFWDEQAAIKEIVTIDKEIQRLMIKLPQDDLQAKITLGKAVYSAVSHKQEAAVTDIQNYLIPYAVDCASNKFLTEEMIWQMKRKQKKIKG